MKHEKIWARVTFLSGKVRAALPPDSPVHQAFARYEEFVDAMPDEMPEPPEKLLFETLAAFENLPNAERVRIMEGWALTAEYPSLRECSRILSGGVVYRYAQLTVDENHLYAGPHYGVDVSNPVPVQVLIVEGTTREDALKYLREMIQAVDVFWTPLTAGEFRFRDKRPAKKNGQPMPTAITPAKQNSRETPELAA